MNNKLKEISKELKTQDNRGTSDPIFLIQEKKRIWGMRMDYAEDHEWIDQDGEVCEGDYIDMSEYESVGYIDIWETVQLFFTEKAAQRYIDSNKHNLNNPRIYVMSGHSNHEWQEVRNYLKEL